MIKELILNMIYCFMATWFFALLMNSPKKVLFHSSLIAAIGYTSYLICINFGQVRLGFFFGTLIIVFLGELLARLIKMPATIFIFPAVIPMVPGLGLYQTMLAFVQENIFGALKIGVDTIVNIGAMAIAMTLMGLIASKIPIKTKKN
ncbi:MAG: threonine/serine exporter family protein [Tissierellia bacterium]|nr:threonine/serine exporter family protein [Tissierellia bacterium]